MAPAKQPPQSPQRAPWAVVTEVLAAAGGLAAVLYFVGGVILWARLRALHLPAESGVASLPTNTLLVAGVRALKVGLLIALAVTFLTVVLEEAKARWRWAGRANLLLAVLLVLPLALDISVQPLEPGYRWALGVAVLVTAGLVAWFLGRAATFRQRAYLLCCAAIALAATAHLLESLSPPTSLSIATARMKSGAVTEGYYLAGSSLHVHLIPHVGDQASGFLVELPRADVASLSLQAAPDRAHPLGGDTAAALTGKPLVRKRPGAQSNIVYLAAVQRASGWVYPPLIPYDTADFLAENRELYDPAVVRRFQAGSAKRVSLPALLADPQLFVAADIIVGGRVTEVATVPSSPDRVVQTIAFRTRRGAGSEASCDVALRKGEEVREGDVVDVRATPVAWGSFNARAGKPIDEVVLVCSSLTRLGSQP